MFKCLGDVKIIFQTVKKYLSHSNIATDTNKTEGNLAEIRAEKSRNENSNK